MITTRTPVADIADHERTSARRRDLEELSRDAGAKLLRALGVKENEENLRGASDEFSGHCLALTLLGSYLTDAYNGDIRCRSEVTARLGHDLRQGLHAQKLMDSYQSWLGKGPDLAVLRMLGLFDDRPADEKALGALLKPPAIEGLTESLTELRPTEWRTILAKLRRARLLAGEDPHNPGQLIPILSFANTLGNDNMRCVALRSGGLPPFSRRFKRWTHPSSLVCFTSRFRNGTYKRSPLAMTLWRKRAG